MLDPTPVPVTTNHGRDRLRRSSILLLPALAVAAALAACGGSGSSPGDGPRDRSADGVGRTAAAAQQQDAGASAGVALPDPCELLTGPELASLLGSATGEGYDPGFSSVGADERSCAWDSTEVLDAASAVVTVRAAGDRVDRGSFPAEETLDVDVEGAADAYGMDETPYRVFFVVGDLSVQATYGPAEAPATGADAAADLARFAAFLGEHLASRL